MRETEKIWMNGELVDWADATDPRRRARPALRLRRLRGHPRLRDRQGLGRLPADRPPAAPRRTRRGCCTWSCPYSVEELRAACHELIGANGLPECYLRPIAFFGYGELGVSPLGNPVDVVIMSWPWGAYLGEEGLTNGHQREDLELDSGSGRT